jgi:predicted ester cyclase
MSFEQNKVTIQQFISGINDGDSSAVNQYIAQDFYNYSPPEGEESAAEIIGQLMGDVMAAFPDLQLEVGGLQEEDDEISFNLTVSGTHSNGLWGAPASGNRAVWTSKVTSRFQNGKFSFCWKELTLPEIMAALRQINMVPAPEDMDKPMKYPVVVPEFLLKVVMTGQAAEKECSHLDMIKVVDPSNDVCEQCVELGDVWPALRMCLVCGFIGCCDTSKNKHMGQHIEESGHPIMRSIRLNESWVWCYEDNAFLSGKVLDRYR